MYKLHKKFKIIRYKSITLKSKKEKTIIFTSASLRGTNSPSTSLMKPGLVITQFRLAERLKASFNLRSSASVTEKRLF